MLVVTYVAQEVTGLPHGRVIGSGTVLDSSRLRHLLAERLGVAVTSVHGLVVGEHGDSQVVLWSSVTVAGIPLLDVVGPNGERIRRAGLEDLGGQVRDAAYGIIAGKGHTNLAIGLAGTRIARAISRDERAVLPVSVRIDVEPVGEVCPSVPSVVGRDGVLATLPVVLDDDERERFVRSAAELRAVIDAVAPDRRGSPPPEE